MVVQKLTHFGFGGILQTALVFENQFLTDFSRKNFDSYLKFSVSFWTTSVHGRGRYQDYLAPRNILFVDVYTKVECVLPMVISTEFRMRQHRNDGHQEDAPHFSMQANKTLINVLERNSFYEFGFSWIID